MIDTTDCPHCGRPAEIQWRSTLASTDGSVEYAKILCVVRHSFLMPYADLAAAMTLS